METAREHLTEALYQKGLALAEIESLKVWTHCIAIFMILTGKSLIGFHCFPQSTQDKAFVLLSARHTYAKVKY